MKLAKIEHYRCGEWDANNYVWVPDAMTREELLVLVSAAQRDCREAEKTIEGVEAPPHRSWWDFFEKADQNKSLATVKLEYAEHEAHYKAWEAKRDAARKSFWQRLCGLSGGKVLSFSDGECGLEVECDWGHSHGLKVNYKAEAELDI